MTIKNELGETGQGQSACRAGNIGMPGHGWDSWENPRFRWSRESSICHQWTLEKRGDPGLAWPLSEYHLDGRKIQKDRKDGNTGRDGRVFEMVRAPGSEFCCTL